MTKKADELARELAGQATTLEDLNGMMRSLMKTAIETMLPSGIGGGWRWLPTHHHQTSELTS